MNRLFQLPTLRVDPRRKLSVKYRKKSYTGYAGDTIATTLFAGGVRIFGRSLKYHRPRGLYSLDGESANTYMAVDGRPNVCAEKTLAKSGMEVAPQNVQGSPEFDRMAIIDSLSFAMPAGFYYRIFHKPAWIWPHAIKQIRKAAGTGELPVDLETPGRFEELYVNTDVCVVGGGPAGMKAALAAADTGLRVVLLEARPVAGGAFDYRISTHPETGKPLYESARDLAEKCEAHPGIRVFLNAPSVGVYPDNLVAAYQVGGEGDAFDERYIEISTRAVVAATGCIERPLLFSHNERPGIMQTACAHRLAHTYGILPGDRAVFSVGDDLGLEAARDLADLGLSIACVADVRTDGQCPELLTSLAERRIPVLKGWTAAKAHGCKAVERATVASVNGAHAQDYKCDLIVASAGRTPLTGVLTLAGAKMAYDNHTGFFLPESNPEDVFPCGSMLGYTNPASIEASGVIAGLSAAAACGRDTAAALSSAEEALSGLPGPARGSKFVCAPGSRKKMFVCFDEDGTLKNVDQAMKNGFDVPELIKRYSSIGTGPGQGGIPGHNLALYVADTQKSPDATPRPTTVRPPLVPTLLAAYAGANHHIYKRTPIHEMQEAAGGYMEKVGTWKRARRFAADPEARSEIAAVRESVGMLDGSTLGKFRIHGPDAEKALQRMYVSDITRCKPGRIFYTAMCNEDACVIDDGVIVKIAENDYYFTTSTGRADVTNQWFRYHTKYENWDYSLVNLTDAYGVINLSGPDARKVLGKITDADVSNEAFPFSAYREITVLGGLTVRAMRLGFVGELSFELHTPASFMGSVWSALEEAGREFSVCCFGLEAQNTMRMEKGHVILGAETEQRTTLHDAGLSFLWHEKQKAGHKTVGAYALSRTKSQEGRLKLVGFQVEEPAHKVPRDGSPIVDARVLGYVCTARWSQDRKAPVGMALVEEKSSSKGSRLGIYEDGCKGDLIYARVIPMPFYDPEGKRMKM